MNKTLKARLIVLCLSTVLALSGPVAAQGTPGLVSRSDPPDVECIPCVDVGPLAPLLAGLALGLAGRARRPE